MLFVVKIWFELIVFVSRLQIGKGNFIWEGSPEKLLPELSSDASLSAQDQWENEGNRKGAILARSRITFGAFCSRETYL